MSRISYLKGRPSDVKDFIIKKKDLVKLRISYFKKGDLVTSRISYLKRRPD